MVRERRWCMSARTVSRLFLVSSLTAAIALSALGRAAVPVAGTDLDALPPGLTPDEEEAWVFARTPVIRIVATSNER
jgi:hypothetical protein